MKTDIMALIVFFMMGFNLCIPVIQRQFTDEATVITVNADSPLDNTSLGWETLDNGTVFHMWNQYNDYYFNRSNGIQFTNHYEEYWTKNILMLGYYNGGQWNLLYRVDKLSGFNEILDNNSEYINVTLWKDLSYTGYDFRLALRYHLGVNDSDLTIVPYIKNLGIDIPFDIGFGWEMKDIRINNNVWQDQININETTYLLNQALNEKYSDITKTIYEYNETTNTTTNYTVKDGSFYLENVNNITGNVDYNLYLKWNPELDYLVTVKSRSGQYNAPVTLFIKAGTLNVGQEKSTEMHWFDSDTLYERYITGDDNHGNTADDVWNSQTFTVGNTGTDENHDVTSVKLKLSRLSTPGEITISIRATDGEGKPTLGDLCSCVYDGDTLPTTAAFVEFVFSSSASLSASTKYAIVVAVPNGVKWTKTVRLRVDTTSPTYTGGSRCYSVDSGSTWTVDTTDDYMFEVYGIASGPSNNAPTQSLQKIWNSTTEVEKSLNATGVSLTPTCFNVTIADTDSDQMNVTIKTNESDTWTIVNQTSSGMSNGTYHGYNTSWIDSYNTKYWISFNVSDDSDWCNETFNFTTETGPWSNTAPVQSAFTVNDLGNNSVDIGRYPQLNITVVDADGNNTIVYWGTNGSAKYQINSSAGNRTCRDMNFSFASAYSTKYYVEISVNDTHDNVTKWYCFTTESEAWSNTASTLTNEIPTNASTDISRWCQLNITVTDADGNNSKVYWYTNASGGVWYLLQTNTSVLNTTVRLMNFTNASSYSTKYWWKVSANDTHCNTTRVYHFTTESEDTTPPNITINFAGNLSDSGGPYWRPPGESDILDEAGEGVWRDGYYTNDSRQHEDWIYCNVTANDSDSSVTNVWLQWLNETTWTNYTYAFVNTVGEYWEYNTSGNIQTCEGYNYSFNIVANSSGGTNTTYWNKTGDGGSYTRRYVHLNCSQVNISYTALYLYKATFSYKVPPPYDRLHHDQGQDGSLTDIGYLYTTIPDEGVDEVHCGSIVGYWFDNNTCIEPFVLNNIYYHTWWASTNGEITVGWYKDRKNLDIDMTDSYSTNDSDSHSQIYYDNGGALYNDTYSLDTHFLDITDDDFTDNDIYELIVKWYPTNYPTIINNRSFTSFVLFNVPDNATLNASHADSDSDSLSDWTELYVTYTNPFLADTDNDGINDYYENLAGSDPNNYTESFNLSWQGLDTWNITIGNMSISPYTLDTWNLTIGNMSVTPYTLDTWNMTLSNLTISPYNLDTWNITLGNTTTGTVLETWNITLGNISVSPYTLDTWNITIGNLSIASFTIDTWNLTLGNMSISPYVLDTWNLTIGNSTLSQYTLDTWNLTLGNMSIASFTIDTWNITLSNTPASYTLDTWNVTLSNTTLSYVLDTWNVTLSNTSLFIIANITATPSTGTISSTIINITCNVTSANAIVNVTVNMTGGTYDMSNISDLYYYASTYNTTGIHYYHIYANDTSGDCLESSVHSFEITGLSCSFTYVVKGSVVTVTPTIVSSTYYKWTVEHNSETEWIPIADIGDHKFVFPYGGKYRIILTAKNETAFVDCSRLITAKASFVEPEPDEEILEEEKKPGLRNVYTDTGISDWIEDRNIGEFILIGVIALIALLAIIKRRPKKLVLYPIKKEKKSEKNE